MLNNFNSILKILKKEVKYNREYKTFQKEKNYHMDQEFVQWYLKFS